MNYTRLGCSDLEVSRICMGCMGFGIPEKGMHSWTVSEEDSRKIIKRGLDLGINFFDTAIAYQGGSSEQFLGRAINDMASRSDVVLASKFLPRSPADFENNISVSEHIRNSLDQSLLNLSTDYIDLYIYHMWDYNSPMEEIMRTLHDAVKRGKVRHLGISNCYAWQLAKANAFAEKENLTKFVSVQGHYNLIFREEEREMVPFCREEGIALTPYSPLASGRLVKDRSETSKRLTEDTYAKVKYDESAKQDALIIGRVAELAEKRGLTRIQVALGWLLSKVTSPVVGVTKLYHIEEAVKAEDVVLSEEDMAYLEEAYIPHPLVGVMRHNAGR